MPSEAVLTAMGQYNEELVEAGVMLGGELATMTFADSPDAEQFPAEHRDRLMHACLTLGEQCLMASDTLPGDVCGGGPYEGIKGCSICLHPESVAEGERLLNGLSEGGQVVMPMEKTFWAERFGMFTDRFGVSWMVNCMQP